MNSSFLEASTKRLNTSLSRMETVLPHTGIEHLVSPNFISSWHMTSEKDREIVPSWKKCLWQISTVSSVTSPSYFHWAVPRLTWPERQPASRGDIIISNSWKLQDPECLQPPGSSLAQGIDNLGWDVSNKCEQNQICKVRAVSGLWFFLKDN